MHKRRMQTKFVSLVWLACLFALLSAAASGGLALAQSNTEVIVHYVEGTFSAEKNAFEVQVFLSVLDGAGKPITGLTAADFSITEDSQKMDIEQVESALSPMNLILLIDTSNSMSNNLAYARRAAQSFVASLGQGDQVAVLSFGEKVRRESEFTSDFKVVSDRIQNIQIEGGGGTCLYDAAYEAVKLAATLPAGRRAVILLTDGRDETLSRTSPTCSTHPVEDVIDMASKDVTRTPIYTIGLGYNTDEKMLARLAEMTGGDYLRSPDISQLSQLFSELSNALKSEYMLTYTSNGAPGPHTVVVEARHRGSIDIDQRDFVLPALPASVKIYAPAPGEALQGRVTAAAEVSPPGLALSAVIFMLNGEETKRFNAPPYKFELENVRPGQYTMEVVVLDINGRASARSSVQFSVLAPPTLTPSPTTTPAPVISPTAEATATARPEPPVPVGLLAGLGVLVAAGGLVAVGALIRRRPRPAEKRIDEAYAFPSVGVSSALRGSPGGGILSEHPIATLTVLNSDDPSMVGQVLNIMNPLTQLGRGAQNDIIFPKDTPVSRQHALIEQKGQQLLLTEIITPDETGALRRPRYGTFVNDQKVGESPVLLRSNDVIRLGSRVRLQIKLPQAPASGDDRTIDNVGDATVDTGDPSSSPHDDHTLP